MNKLTYLKPDALAYLAKGMFPFLRIKVFIQATRICSYVEPMTRSLYAPVMSRQIGTFFASHIDLSGFRKIILEVKRIALSRDAEAENALENPRNVVPVASTIKIPLKYDYYTLPMSLLIFRIKTKNE